MHAIDKDRRTAVKIWLESVSCYGCLPVLLTIGQTVYQAVEYWQDRQAPEGCANPGKYTIHGYYCLGFLPPSYKRDKAHYLLPDDSRPWFIAGYWPYLQQKEHRLVQQYQPFGANFLLFPWDHDSDIDYGYKPRPQIPIAVEG